MNVHRKGARAFFCAVRGINAARRLTPVRKAVLVLLVFGLSAGLEARAGSTASPLLHQKLEEISRFVREHTGYTTLTLPKVVFLSPDRMEALRYGSDWRAKGYPETVALAAKGVIYLSTSFRLGRDDYILAHELTHYQQFESGKQWQCSAAMEPEAYRVQNLWVRATGRGESADLLGPVALSDCGLNP